MLERAIPVLDLLINLSGAGEMKKLTHYASLSQMFTYPEKDLEASCDTWRKIALDYNPALTLKLDPFIKHLHEKPLAFQQEYYISTFDVQALCFLDVGYVLFGEDYKRGNFLVHMKREQEKACNNCGREMPDHLPNILTLIPKLQDADLAEELVCSLVMPAIQEMISKFRSVNNFYNELLKLVVAIMKIDFPGTRFERYKFGTTGKLDLLNGQPMGCQS